MHHLSRAMAKIQMLNKTGDWFIHSCVHDVMTKILLHRKSNMWIESIRVFMSSLSVTLIGGASFDGVDLHEQHHRKKLKISVDFSNKSVALMRG
jgi:hypothetical protein